MIVALLAALIACAVLIAPTVTPGVAQKMGNQKKEEPKKKNTGDEKDYKAAVDRLPDQKFDPWRNIR
jgi:hypothetical protein